MTVRRTGRATRAACAGLLVLLAAVALTGCASRYQITLSNGTMITTGSKPKYDAEHGVYRFKDLQGNPTYLPAFRIKEIAPK
jgi:hypothetical protein